MSKPAWQNPMFMFDNKYGYLVKINHPLIRPLYYQFKKWKGIPRSFPLSDEERFEFEKYIIKKFSIKTEIRGKTMFKDKKQYYLKTSINFKFPKDALCMKRKDEILNG